MVGFGQIIQKPKFKLFIVVFEKIFPSKTLPVSEEIVKSTPLLIGYTLDGLLYNNSWKIVGNIKNIVASIPLPYYKLGTPPEIYLVNHKGETLRRTTSSEISVLNYETTLSPIYYEGALKAWHKIIPWEKSFDEILYSNILKQIAFVG